MGVFLPVVASAVGGLGGVLAAAGLLAVPEARRRQLVPWLLAFATGTLLAAALVGLLPEALAQGRAEGVLLAVLAGVLGFFVLHKALIWRHCHDEDCSEHAASAPLILAGDSIHNFLDGAVIASAFAVSTPLGVATAVAVVAHEVPQEVGDFAILLHAGFSRRKALVWNAVTALASVLGAGLTVVAMELVRPALPWVMAVAAANFLYVSVGDLMPAMHERKRPRETLAQLGLMLAGVAVVLLLRGR